MAPAIVSRADIIMPTPVFAIDDVQRTLAASNSFTSYGLDGLPAVFIKKFP